MGRFRSQCADEPGKGRVGRGSTTKETAMPMGAMVTWELLTMKQIFYTLHFRGQASRSAEDATLLKTTATGTSCTMETVVGPTGVETTLHSAPGDLAFLESDVRLAGQDGFEGRGVLTFGDAGEHEIRFATFQAGRLEPSAVPAVMAGTVSWRVEGGSGRFESATGFITSTFTLTSSGELSEYHCGLIFIAD
jgi:hypothetical protein